MSFSLELLAEDDRAEGVEQDLEVEPPGAVPQVVEVILQAAQHLFHRVRISVVERCVRGNSGTDLIEVGVTYVVLHDLVDVELAFGSGTDKGHIAAEYGPQLR